MTPSLPTATAARDALCCARFQLLLWDGHPLDYLVRIAVLMQAAEAAVLGMLEDVALVYREDA